MVIVFFLKEIRYAHMFYSFNGLIWVKYSYQDYGGNIMDERILTQEQLRAFSDYLYQEEKSAATREKYLRDA